MGVFVLTNPWQTDDNDDDANSKDPVRAQLRKLEKENKDLMGKLNAALAAQRTSTIKDVLSEKKLPAKLAKLIPNDVEPTTEAVQKWLDEYGDLFTQTPTSTNSTDADTKNDTGGNAETTDEDSIAAMNAALRLAQVTNGGKAPSSKPEELLAKILDPTLKQEDLMKLIEANGGGVGVG